MGPKAAALGVQVLQRGKAVDPVPRQAPGHVLPPKAAPTRAGRCPALGLGVACVSSPRRENRTGPGMNMLLR